MSFAGVVQTASNVRIGSGDPITGEQVLEVYPQFGPDVVPSAYFEMILARANDCIQESRWRSSRKLAVCLYVAHYCTMYLKTAVPVGTADIKTVVNAGETKGAITSKSVDGVSVSYSASEGSSDYMGYGELKNTIYGQQLASLAKRVGAGMMVIR